MKRSSIALIISGLSMFSLGLINYVTLAKFTGGWLGAFLIVYGLGIVLYGVWVRRLNA